MLELFDGVFFAYGQAFGIFGTIEYFWQQLSRHAVTGPFAQARTLLGIGEKIEDRTAECGVGRLSLAHEHLAGGDVDPPAGCVQRGQRGGS